MEVHHVQKTLDEISRRLVASWIDGQRHPIEEILRESDDFFAFDAAERRESLVQLIHQEVELRRKAGQSPATAEYADRFPDVDRSVIEDVMQLPALPTATFRIHNSHSREQVIRPKNL